MFSYSYLCKLQKYVHSQLRLLIQNKQVFTTVFTGPSLQQMTAREEVGPECEGWGNILHSSFLVTNGGNDNIFW